MGSSRITIVIDRYRIVSLSIRVKVLVIIGFYFQHSIYDIILILAAVTKKGKLKKEFGIYFLIFIV